jgi:hypothetical protein
MADAQTVFKARKNGVNAVIHGERMNVDEVMDLLVESSQPSRHPAVRVNANRLIEQLARGPWRLNAGPHAGGFGGTKHPPDRTNHITVQSCGGGYHLRQDARGHLFEITGPGMAPIQPSSAPGNAPGEMGRDGRS